MTKAFTFVQNLSLQFMSNPKIHYLPTEPHNSNIHVELKKPKSVRFLQFVFSIAQKIAPEWSAKQALSLFVTPRIRAKHAVSDDLLNEMIRHDFLVDDNKIRIYEWKGGSKKVVLLHGWESRATALRSVVPSLLERGFTVFGIDAPAHGESEGRHTNVVEYANIINLASEHFGPFDLAVTHSFGGLAISFALVEIPKFAVPKIVMLGQPATTKYALQGLYRLLHLEHSIQKRLENKIFSNTGYHSDQLSVAFLSTKFKNTRGILFHDEKDNLVPLHSAIEVVNNWQLSQLYVTHGLGHFRLIKSKEVRQCIFNWIDSNDYDPETP